MSDRETLAIDRNRLAEIPDGTFHTCVTSPPYWGLRDYGLEPVEWPAVSYAPMAGLPEIEVPGCDPGCAHEWGEERILSVQSRPDYSHGKPLGTRGQQPTTKAQGFDASQGSWCSLCGGWRGSLGLEPDVSMFVGHIVAIWRELWRVLRDDGTSWVNFGDSYFGDSPTRKRSKEAFSREWDKSQTASRGGLRRSADGGRQIGAALHFGRPLGGVADLPRQMDHSLVSRFHLYRRPHRLAGLADGRQHGGAVIVGMRNVGH